MRTIDSPPNGFASVLTWLLAVVAGYGTAAIVNIALFVYCGREACLSDSSWSTAPGWLAFAVGGWFVRHRGSQTTAAAAGAAIGLLLAASAPLRLQQPLSFSMNDFPGDFLIGLVFAPLSAMLMLVTAQYLVLLLPLVAGGALFTAIVRSALPLSLAAQRVRIAAAGGLIAAALIAEIVTTPTAWSLGVHRRIAAFDLPAPAGAVPSPYRAWARKELSLSLSPGVTANAVLGFYDRLFNGWRALDRTAEDGIWIDPTGTVMAWAYCAGTSAHVSLTDFDRAAWHQRFRRNSSGERILDLATDIR